MKIFIVHRTEYPEDGFKIVAANDAAEAMALCDESASCEEIVGCQPTEDKPQVLYPLYICNTCGIKTENCWCYCDSCQLNRIRI